MSYRLAIFDFDGTLADSAGWFMGAMNKAAIRFGFRTLGEEEIAMLRGRSNREIIHYLQVPLWKMPKIARYIRHLAAEDVESIRLFGGADDLLRRLHSTGVRIAIVSSNAETTIRQVLGADNAALVEIYACGASLFGKAAKFRRVMRLTGVAASEVIAIGDEARDIEAAREAGVAAGAVTWGYATPALLHSCEPDVVFTSLFEAADWLTAASRLKAAE